MTPKSDFNPRTLKAGFERVVYDMLIDILARLKSIENQRLETRE